MDSALELRRQLLDVYSAVDRVRTGSLKHEIVPPDPDSRERTELGRRAIDMEASGVEVDEFGDVVEDVKLNSVFDVANLSITATGGRTNVSAPPSSAQNPVSFIFRCQLTNRSVRGLASAGSSLRILCANAASNRDCPCG